MPVGDCERAFAMAAAADGIALTRARVPWLNQRGHLGIPDAPTTVLANLQAIFDALGGRVDEQASKRWTSLPGDFFHEESGTFIEVDESQHFTSFRLLTLDLYPPEAPLGFDTDAYRALCRDWAERSDKYRKSKAAVGFGEGGRQRQRAYHDALRDLVTPALGHPPVIRVAALDRDGAAAYHRVRDRLQECSPGG
jgi:hypothetical protein